MKIKFNLWLQVVNLTITYVKKIRVKLCWVKICMFITVKTGKI